MSSSFVDLMSCIVSLCSVLLMIHLGSKTSKDVQAAVQSHWKEKTRFKQNKKINQTLSGVRACLGDFLNINETRVSFVTVNNVGPDLADAAQRIFDSREDLLEKVCLLQNYISLQQDPVLYKILDELTKKQIGVAQSILYYAIFADNNEKVNVANTHHLRLKKCKEQIIEINKILDSRIRKQAV